MIFCEILCEMFRRITDLFNKNLKYMLVLFLLTFMLKLHEPCRDKGILNGLFFKTFGIFLQIRFQVVKMWR